MKRKEILEGWGNDDWGSMSKRDFKRRELELELGDEEPGRQRRRGYYNPPQRSPEVKSNYNLVNTATGKMLSKDGVPSVFSSERHAQAVAAKLKFGSWKPVPAKTEETVQQEEMGYDQISPKSARYILRKMEQGVPMSSILEDFPELYRMMEIIAGEQGLHMDDDFEDIEASLYHDLEDLAGSDEEDEEVREMTPPTPGKIQKVNPDGTADVVDPKGTVTKIDQKAIVPDADDPNKLTVNVPKPKLTTGTNVTMTSEELRRIRELAGLKENTGLPIIKAKDLINNIAAEEPEAAQEVAKFVVATPDGNVDIKQTFRKMSGEFIRMFPDLIDFFEEIMNIAKQHINSPEFKTLPPSGQKTLIDMSQMGPQIQQMKAQALDAAKTHDAYWNQDAQQSGQYPSP